MKVSPGRILTHALCLAAGIGIAVSLGRSGVKEDFVELASVASQAAGQAVSAQQEVKKSSAEGTGRKPALMGIKSGEFREAWNAIASRNLTIPERLEMQIAVLREWAKVDMEGAMRAALANAWDGDVKKGGVSPLMAAFDEAFRARPLDAWDLLQSGKLGLGTELFRQQWIKSASETEPAFVFSVAAQIPYDLRMSAIQSAMRSAARSPELKDEMLRKLADLPENGSSDNYIAIAFNALPANEGNAAAIRERFNAATNERAKTILLHEYLSTMREAGGDAILSEWSRMTPEMQKRAAVGFYNGAQGTRNAPAVLDMLMKTDQWDRIHSAGQRLEQYGRETRDPQALAEWGMNLPERPEAADLFRKSIEPLINRSNAEARQWIESLPSGDWRSERALYAYTQNALYARNNTELYQWAVDRITDPDLKASATRSYDSWAQRRGLVK